MMSERNGTVMTVETHEHLYRWSESGQAPYGYSPESIRESIRDYLASLDAEERESALNLGWPRLHECAQSWKF